MALQKLTFDLETGEERYLPLTPAEVQDYAARQKAAKDEETAATLAATTLATRRSALATKLGLTPDEMALLG